LSHKGAATKVYQNGQGEYETAYWSSLTELSNMIDQFAKDPVKTKQELMLLHAQGFCPKCTWNSNDCDCVRAGLVPAIALPQPKATPSLRKNEMVIKLEADCHCDIKNLASYGHEEGCAWKR